MSVTGSQVRSREEVMNVLLAEYINDSGMSAEAENVETGIGGGRSLPDVIVSVQGLRCSIEGKWHDAQRARDVVSDQAKDRIQKGIAHIALAVVYPTFLRDTPQRRKKEALREAQLEYRVFTEQAVGAWREGRVEALLDDLRRSQDLLATDDIVTAAVHELQEGMFGLVHLLTGHAAACERLAEILSVYEPERESDDAEE